jgi:hypothetical protein
VDFKKYFNDECGLLMEFFSDFNGDLVNTCIGCGL